MAKRRLRACLIEYKFYESTPRPALFADALADAGYTVDAFALRRPGQPRHECIRGVHVYRIQERTVDERTRAAYLCRIIRFFIRATLYVSTWHLIHPYRLIHVESVPDFLVFSAIVPKLLGTPVILDVYDILPEFYASKFHAPAASRVLRALLMLERCSVAFADHVIASNHLWSRRLLARTSAQDKCSTICYSPDPKIFVRKEKGRADGKFIILYPGTLNSRNGLDIAIHAFAMVATEIPCATLVIYGDGPARPGLKRLAEDLGVSARIEFHEIVPAHEIAKIMADSDVAIVPKKCDSAFGNEAASTKILDLMAVGTPVIAADTAVERYYFNDSVIRFFEAGNAGHLASRILELYRRPDIGRALSLNATQFIKTAAWLQSREQYLRIVTTITRRH